MKKHLGYTALSSGIFFLSTAIVLLITGAGPQVEGFLSAVDHEGVIRNILIDATLIGFLTGGMATFLFRQSMNHRIYTLITIVLMMVFTEFVIITIL